MKKLFILVMLTFVSLLVQPRLAQAAEASCNDMKPLDTQFRVSGNDSTPWVNGRTMSDAKLAAGTKIDVNCFANNGAATMSNTAIELKDPKGTTSTLSNGPELRNWSLPAISGKYSFTCKSLTFSNCSNSDNFSIKVSAATSQPTSPKPTATPVTSTKPTPAPADVAHTSRCEDLTVASGNNSTVPAKVVLRARASDNKGSIQKYKFYFGDSKQIETDSLEVEHSYESSGSFVARVDIKDNQGVWKTSSSCEATVSVKKSAVESHKSGCSDVFITEGNRDQAPTTVKFRITGYDNKNNLKHYKLDFGNGVTKESDGQTFEQRYDKAGTYVVKAYVQDSEDTWKGGDQSCQQTLYIATKPLTRQPQTGTPTWFTFIGLGAGTTSAALYTLKKKVWRK